MNLETKSGLANNSDNAGGTLFPMGPPPSEKPSDSC